MTDRQRMRRVRGLVRLHMKKDPRSFEGLLVGSIDGHYQLTNAKFLQDANREHDVAIDGETFVPKSDVHYVQKVG